MCDNIVAAERRLKDPRAYRQVSLEEFVKSVERVPT